MFPQEIWIIILSYIPELMLDDLFLYRQISKNFKRLIEKSELSIQKLLVNYRDFYCISQIKFKTIQVLTICGESNILYNEKVLSCESFKQYIGNPRIIKKLVFDKTVKLHFLNLNPCAIVLPKRIEIEHIKIEISVYVHNSLFSFTNMVVLFNATELHPWNTITYLNDAKYLQFENISDFYACKEKRVLSIQENIIDITLGVRPNYFEYLGTYDPLYLVKDAINVYPNLHTIKIYCNELSMHRTTLGAKYPKTKLKSVLIWTSANKTEVAKRIREFDKDIIIYINDTKIDKI
jgi:hypothetical protein